jgi:hypothetical protein
VSEPLSAVGRAIMGETEEPDRQVPCMRCKRMTVCPGFIITAVKRWNHEERERAGNARVPQYLTYAEIVPCDACLPVVFAEKRADDMLVHNTTDIYLRELRAGRYNPESINWLRRHGWAAEVQRVLSEEGNKSHADE